MVQENNQKVNNNISVSTIRNIIAILLIWWSTFPLFSYYTRTVGFLIIVVFWFVFSGILTSEKKVLSLISKSKYLLVYLFFIIVLFVVGHGSNMFNYIWSLIIILVYLSIFSVYQNDTKNRIKITINNFPSVFVFIVI